MKDINDVIPESSRKKQLIAIENSDDMIRQYEKKSGGVDQMHPLNQAYVKYKKASAARGVRVIKKKPERRDQDVIHINGKN